MADTSNARQQIVDKVKDASNILVTVSTNPTVDDLSAALGLTLMLNKLKKHSTAVVSGAIPPAITFLDPSKVFEGTADSLRDFIIALDKEKADHLRYKVDGDVVKIFITPYRTTVTEKDLEFSQGDYNVDLVMALGVKDESHLDTALSAHGRILHDATVVTMTVGSEPSNLGNVDWRDEGASSLCEMLLSLSEAIKSDKPLLDEQISTALLTGIVAATDRFSNGQTTPKVMTMAAQLMAAGANQQLIASELRGQDLVPQAPKAVAEPPKNSDGTTDLSEGTPTQLPQEEVKQVEQTPEKPAKKPDGTLTIAHEEALLVGDVDTVAHQVARDNNERAKEEVEDKLDQLVQPSAKKSALKLEMESLPEPEQEPAGEVKLAEPLQTEPSLGGTLNATTEEAAEAKAREEGKDRNRTLLSHDGSAHVSSNDANATMMPLFNSAAQPDKSEPATVDPFAYIEQPVEQAPAEKPADVPAPAPAPVPTPTPEVSEPIPAPTPEPAPALEVHEEPEISETLADIDAKVRVPEEEEQQEDPMAAVHAAYDAPAPAPAGLPPLPDFSTLPPPPPPLPDLPGTGAPAGALTPEKLADLFAKEPAQQTPAAPASEDPGQFKIPGQS